MLLPPFWRGRGKHVPAGNRLARLRRILKASLATQGYRDRLNIVKLGAPDLIDSIEDPDRALRLLEPITFVQYCSFFKTRKGYAEGSDKLLVPYREARAGLTAFRNEDQTKPDRKDDLYSTTSAANATGDLFRLARSLAPSAQAAWKTDHALVVFSGMEVGVLTDDERDLLWRQYHVPLFEQFLGTDGKVVASECEIHSGLHIRMESVILESVYDELLLTSLTDEQCPAVRVRTGFSATIEHDVCECGRVEPRLMGLRTVENPQANRAVA